jgi:hypothetical protein
MFEATGNLLTDLFSTKDLIHKSGQFKEFLKQKNQIPFVHFDGENDFENKFYVIRSNGEKSTFKQIYDELGYKLNRGPIFYFSECVVNYTFETFIIFVQDGWILEDPNNEGAIALYPWNVWGEVLFTKHKDMNAAVILMAYPTQDNAYELSISPQLDLKTNVVISPSEGGGVTAKYTDDLQATMTFAYSILKRYWQVVEDNRGKSINTIPLEMLYILNEKSVNSLDDELQALETQSGPDKPEKMYNAHVYAFYYIHFAKIADGVLTKEELHTIADKIALWVMNDFSRDQLEAKVRSIVQESKQWYDSLDPKAQEEEIIKICDWLKTHLSEFGDYHKDFLQDLVDIARADVNFSQKEKDLISHTAEQWGIEFEIAG